MFRTSLREPADSTSRPAVRGVGAGWIAPRTRLSRRASPCIDVDGCDSAREGAPVRHTGPALAAAVAFVALSLVAVGACGGDGGDPGGGKTPPPVGAADITGRLSQLSAVAAGRGPAPLGLRRPPRWPAGRRALHGAGCRVVPGPGSRLRHRGAVGPLSLRSVSGTISEAANGLRSCVLERFA